MPGIISNIWAKKDKYLSFPAFLDQFLYFAFLVVYINKAMISDGFQGFFDFV
jgi:hypothetical protein